MLKFTKMVTLLSDWVSVNNKQDHRGLRSYKLASNYFLFTEKNVLAKTLQKFDRQIEFPTSIASTKNWKSSFFQERSSSINLIFLHLLTFSRDNDFLFALYHSNIGLKPFIILANIFLYIHYNVSIVHSNVFPGFRIFCPLTGLPDIRSQQ